MRLLSLMLLVVALAATAADDPLHTSSVFDPEAEVRLYEPPIRWQVTDGDEDSGDVLGEITDITMDGQGNTYLLDTSFNTVRIYGPDGEFQGTLGREGDGPGEFRNPEDCIVLSDGRLGVVQLMPGQVTTILPDGDPGEPIRPPSDNGGMMNLLMGAQPVDGAIYTCSSTMSMSDEGITTISQLLRLSLEGEVLSVIKSKEDKVESSGGVIAMRAGSDDDFTGYWSAAPDGRIYIAPRYDAYMMEVLNPEGELEQVIEVEYEHVKRTDEEIESLQTDMQFATPHGEIELPPVNPMRRDITRMYPRPDGTLWVASSSTPVNRPEGAVGAFDVFDREGRLTGRVAIDVDFDRDYDRFHIVGDYLFVCKEVLAAPESSPSGGGGAMVVRIGERRAPVDEDREPMPYSVVCYDLSGM